MMTPSICSVNRRLVYIKQYRRQKEMLKIFICVERGIDSMLPEEKARVKIDKQLRNAGWDIVARDEYLPKSTSAIKEALMVGNTESDYLLFIDGKAIAVVE